jgi:hypothetical protein
VKRSGASEGKGVTSTSLHEGAVDGIPRGWLPDPWGIHEYRYFSVDGYATRLVRDADVLSHDPPRHDSRGTSAALITSLVTELGGSKTPECDTPTPERVASYDLPPSRFSYHAMPTSTSGAAVTQASEISNSTPRALPVPIHQGMDEGQAKSPRRLGATASPKMIESSVVALFIFIALTSIPGLILINSRTYGDRGTVLLALAIFGLMAAIAVGYRPSGPIQSAEDSERASPAF